MCGVGGRELLCQHSCFFQAEDGIRDGHVTGVQTCALPIYPAQVARTANALDPTSRTLQVELLVDNASGELFPGAYADVHFKLPPGVASLRMPANAVLFRSTDLQVAVVGADHHVTLKNITTGRDFATSLEVLY